MDQAVSTVIQRRMERTVTALKRNQINAQIVSSHGELLDAIGELMPKGASCSVGGSETLKETGVLEFLKGGEYDYLDRYAEGADVRQVFLDAMGCDVYFTSANAITENGELYNMDGNGNRVAALAFGPKKVVVVAGYNKIVPDLAAARVRNCQIAAPANAVRLHIESLPCTHTGICCDCHNPERICATEVITRFQRNAERVYVFLLPESLGY